MEISGPKIKMLLFFRKKLPNPENQTFLIFFFKQAQKKKDSYTFSYKETKNF